MKSNATAWNVSLIHFVKEKYDDKHSDLREGGEKIVSMEVCRHYVCLMII
jgi:hypothetical protein